MASNRFSFSTPSSGIREPVFLYLYDPQSKFANDRAKPPSRSAHALRTSTAAAMTSLPIPSPGMTAIFQVRMVCPRRISRLGVASNRVGDQEPLADCRNTLHRQLDSLLVHRQGLRRELRNNQLVFPIDENVLAEHTDA